MTNKGWVKLWRDQFNSWISKKPFCDGYAWCYLYQRANHKKGMINFRNEYIQVERGQFLTSKLQLQEIYGWTYRHVENFLKALENDEMIRNRTTNRYIVITIVNYSKYQSNEEQSVEQNDEQVMNRLGTGYEQIRNEATQTRINKNEKNEKNEESSAQSSKELKAKVNINFNFETKEWENITEEDKGLWQEAFPACNITLNLKQMKVWLIDNPKKRKKNYGSFISKWLARQQEKGGNIKSERYKTDISKKYRTI